MSARVDHPFLALLVPLLLGSCHVLPEQGPAARLHDLGPSRGAAAPGARRTSVVVTGVVAPPWRSTADVQYRFLFDDPTRLRAYANTQWVAPPPALLEQRLREAFPADSEEKNLPGAGETQRGVMYCEVRLVVFEQQFRDPRSAEVVIRLEVTARRAVDGLHFARTVITARRACRPDVRGAVSGLAALVDEAILEFTEWTARIDPRVTHPVSFPDR